MVHRRVFGNGKQPRRKLVFGIEAVNVFVGFYEGILCQILGILSIVHHRI